MHEIEVHGDPGVDTNHNPDPDETSVDEPGVEPGVDNDDDDKLPPLVNRGYDSDSDDEDDDDENKNSYFETF